MHIQLSTMTGSYTSAMAGEHDADSELPRRGAALDTSYRDNAAVLRELAERKFRVPRDEAEAIVNDVFMSLLLRADTIRQPQRWLVGAVCHASRDYLRKRSKTEALPPDIEDYVDPFAADSEETLIRRLTLAVAMSRLGNRCATALRMHHAEGYSAPEIARRLQISIGATEQLLHRCRKKAHEIFSRLMKEWS